MRDRVQAWSESLMVRLLVTSAVLLSIGAVVTAWRLDRSAQRESIAAAQEHSLGVAVALAAAIDGAAHQRDAAEAPMKDAFVAWSDAPEGVRSQQAVLAGVAAEVGLLSPAYTLELRRSLRTAVVDAPTEARADAMEFVLSSADAPYWRHRYEYRPAMAGALLDGRAVVSDPYHDDHGSWVSAWAPLRDADGAVVGILAVDRPLDAVLSAARTRLFGQLQVLTVMGAMTLLAIGLIARRVTHSIHEVEQAARRIAAGDFEHVVPARGIVEVASLGRRVEQARAALYRAACEAREAESDARQALAHAMADRKPAVLERRRRIGEAEVSGTLVVGGRPSLCQVMDVSFRRCVVWIDDAPSVVAGERVSLSVGSDDPLDAVVCDVIERAGRYEVVVDWCDGEAPHALPRPVQRLADERRARRVRPAAALGLRAQVAWGDARLKVDVTTLSATGVGLRVPPGAQPTTREILVRLDTAVGENHRIWGRVVRVVQDDAGMDLGVQFEESAPGYGAFASWVARLVHEADRLEAKASLATAGPA